MEPTRKSSGVCIVKVDEQTVGNGNFEVRVFKTEFQESASGFLNLNSETVMMGLVNDQPMLMIYPERGKPFKAVPIRYEGGRLVIEVSEGFPDD